MKAGDTLKVFETPRAVAAAGADLFRELANRKIKESGRFVVALSGGSTPKQMFEVLAASAGAARNTPNACTPPAVAWDKVHLFWGDERSVPLDHADSNYHTAHELFLTKVPLNPGNIHPMPAWDTGTDSAQTYQNTLAATFGCDRFGVPPAFDLIYLGMGPDAHTASLFPHTKALEETRKWVVRNEVPKLSTTRMTFTYPLINAAHAVCFLICGADKALPLAKVIEGPKDLPLYPSQGIRPQGELIWYLDAAAAAKLSRNPEHA